MSGVANAIVELKAEHAGLRRSAWSWEDNLRAIALALEALRKVDRYGVTRRGEQYTGWKQLTAGDSGPSAERGRRLIADAGGVAEALKATHPDLGGAQIDFESVQLARREGGQS